MARRNEACPARFVVRVLGALLAALAVTGVAGTARAQAPIEVLPDVANGGRAVALTVNPVSDATVIAAAESGGLFRTTDGGASWRHLDGLPMFRIIDVKYSPTDANLVIATGWSGSGRGNDGGIWRSADGGATWSKPRTSRPPAGPRCSSLASAWGIAFDPGGSRVYVATDCGIATSVDGGVTWSHSVVDPRAPHIRSIDTQSGTAVACGDGGVYRFTAAVGIWIPTGGGIGGCRAGPHQVSASPVDSTVFVSTAFNNLYESDDGGLTWRAIPVPNARSARPNWVRAGRSSASPGALDVYWSSGAQLFRQTCGAAATPGPRCAGSFAGVPFDHVWDPNDLVFGRASACPLMVVSDGGVHRTSDCGATFPTTARGSSGYGALQVYDVAAQILSDHTDLYFGTQDNNQWGSGDGGRTWPFRYGNEGGLFQMARHAGGHDPQEAVIYHDYGAGGNQTPGQHLGSSGMWRDPPGGGGAPVLVERGVYVQWSTVAQRTSLWLTVDSGATWTSRATSPYQLVGQPQLSGPPDDPTVYQAVAKPGTTRDGDPVYGLIRITGVRGSDPATVSPADRGFGSIGVYSAGDGSWASPPVWAVNPDNPGELLAADVDDDRMKYSYTGGQTWREDAELTALVTRRGEFAFHVPSVSIDPYWLTPGKNVQAHAIGWDPDDPARILVGTEATGLIRSTTGGGTWERQSESERVTGTTALVYDRSELGEAIVATYGRGLWRVSLPPSRPWLLPERPYLGLVRGWIRDPRTGDLITPDDLRNPDYCPVCQFLIAPSGAVRGFASKGGLVARVHLADGELLSSRNDGRRASVPVAVDHRVGQSFAGCPACAKIVAGGGSIRGLILEKGRLVAVVGGRGRLPGLGSLKRFARRPRAARLPRLQAPRGPYAQIVRADTTGGLPTVRAGERMTVAGTGFCRAGSCPSVSLEVAGKVVAKGVKVTRKGTFRASFEVALPLGGYAMRVVQKGKPRTLVGFVVAIGDPDQAEEAVQRR